MKTEYRTMSSRFPARDPKALKTLITSAETSDGKPVELDETLGLYAFRAAGTIIGTKPGHIPDASEGLMRSCFLQGLQNCIQPDASCMIEEIGPHGRMISAKMTVVTVHGTVDLDLHEEARKIAAKLLK